MTDPSLIFAGTFAVIWHAVHGTIRAAQTDDRGAVSIEHVLWYAAAAISVAVVAAIIWSQVRTTASTPVQSPSAP
jgi:Flp pilus assembly pilin Flp